MTDPHAFLTARGYRHCAQAFPIGHADALWQKRIEGTEYYLNLWEYEARGDRLRSYTLELSGERPDGLWLKAQVYSLHDETLLEQLPGLEGEMEAMVGAEAKATR